MTKEMKTDGPQMDLFLAAPALEAAARPAPKARKPGPKPGAGKT